MIAALSTRLQVRGWGLVGDLIAVTAVVSYASGIGERSDGVFSWIAIPLWAVTARLLTPSLQWLSPLRERIGHLAGTAVALFVLFGVFGVLIEAGWSILYGSLPLTEQPDTLSLIAVFGVWSSSYFLARPGLYRFFDGAALFGLIIAAADGCSGFVVAASTTLAGLVLSASSRNLTETIYHGVHRPRIPWRPVVVRNLGMLAIFVAVFAGLERLTVTWILPPHREPSGVPADPNEFVEEVDRDERQREGDPSLTLSDSTPAGGRIRSNGTGRNDGDKKSGSPRFAMRARSAEDAVAFAPDQMRLWRTETLTEFDGHSWRATPVDRRSVVPIDELLQLEPSDDLDFPSTTITLDIEVRTEAASLLPLPYFTDALSFPAAVSLARLPIPGEATVRVEPPLPPEASFSLQFRSRIARSATLRNLTFSGYGTHPDSRTLKVPKDDRLGLDLDSLVGTSKPDESIGARVVRVRRVFEEHGMLRSQREFVDSSRTRFARAWIERIGDMRDFATLSALMLRSSGVSTRVARGYAYATPSNGSADEWWLLEQNDYMWIEVFVPRAGWIPVDPSQWGAMGIDAPESDGLTPDTLVDPAVALDDFESMAGDFDSKGAVSGELAAGGSGSPGSNSTGPNSKRLGARGPGAIEIDQLPGAELARGTSRDGRASPAEAKGRDVMDSDGDGVGGRAEAARFADSRSDSNVDAPAGGALDEVIDAADTSEEDTLNRDQRQPPPIALDSPEQDADPALSTSGRVLRLLLVVLAVAGGIWLLRRVSRGAAAQDEEELGSEELDSTTVAVPTETLKLEQLANEPLTSFDDVIAVYETLQRDLSKKRSARRSTETPLEHSRRFAPSGTRGWRALNTLVRLVYRYAYSSREPDPTDLETAKSKKHEILTPNKDSKPTDGD